MHIDFWGQMMAIREINSADNALIKKVAKLKNKKYREEYLEFIAEGRLSLEAGLSSGFELSFAVCSKSFAEEEKEFLAGIDEVIITTDKIFEKISDAVTPQGILGVFKIAENEFDENSLGNIIVYCDNLRDPGNAGTIIRTADALGVDAVMFSNFVAEQIINVF